MSDNMKTFTIVDSESQKVKEIQSNASTVGELKRDLRLNGFKVDGKTIQEGLTRTEFKDDSSLLPHDVPTKKGGFTNDLVFRLTKTDKNVASGMDRKEAYEEVKKLGLGDAIKAKYGKNFTQCSTNDLIDFIQKHKKAGKPAEKVNTPVPNKEVKPSKPEPSANKKNDNNAECGCKAIIKALCNKLVENDVLSEEDVEDIFNGEMPSEAPASKNTKYSQQEIKAMFGGM